MCGLAGYWTAQGGKPDATAMATALSHRGPDDAGAWADADAGIALSHRRLAIVDLSPAGHQPMHSLSGRYVLTFNGEIYNHQHLRAELERDGQVEWKGHSDTETLVMGIERWGLTATLERAAGMWALALWDRQDRTLRLARDRMGEKPLFWGWSAAGLVFGSELKALRHAPGFDNPVDEGALSLFLRFNYVPAPFSILRNIFKVEPGVIVTLDARALTARPDQPPATANDGRFAGVSCRRYWSLSALAAAGADITMSEDEAILGLEARLTEAVRLQTVADVPVGAFLSGGIDSSAIAALMRTVSTDVKTFTIGFEEAGFDEAPYARAVAAHLGTDHTELYVRPQDVRAIIPELPRIYDEPFADSSQLPTVLLSRLTRQSVTVALSGDAGDEMFGGYNRYRTSRRWWNAAAALPPPARRALGRTITAVRPATWDRIGRLPLLPRVPLLGNKAHKVGRMLGTSLGARDIYRMATEEWNGTPPLVSGGRYPAPVETMPALGGTPAAAMMYWDAMSYLPDDILVKVDRAAMAASLETRVPFLDHRVVEQAWRTPLSFKIRDGQGKWILRQILYRHVPASLIERPKAGFSIPIGEWLRGPLRDWAEALLRVDALSRTPSLDAAMIRRHWAEHLSGSNDRTGAIWGILMFQAWAAEWARPLSDAAHTRALRSAPACATR